MNKKLRLISVSAASFLILLATVFSSCEKQEQNFGPTTFYKPCEDVFCLNGGTCRDGNCECPAGFEGAKCEVKSVEKFIGEYKAYDDCYLDGKEPYDASISVDFDPVNELTLKGFGKTCPNDLKAFITINKTNFDIPFQQSCGNYWVSGEGNLRNNVLNVNLVIRDSALQTSTSCSILMNKQ